VPAIEHSASQASPALPVSSCAVTLPPIRNLRHIHIFVLSHTLISRFVLVSSVNTSLSPLLVINSLPTTASSQRTPSLTYHSPRTTEHHCHTPALHAITQSAPPKASIPCCCDVATTRHQTSLRNIPARSGLTQCCPLSDLPRANAYTRSRLHH